jgi:hypothetical protein
MSNKLQNFLANAAIKAASDLEVALMRLPEDKRDWSAQGDARSALDLVAECAILNGSTVDLIKTRQFPPDYDMASYMTEKAELAKDWEALQSLLHQNTARVVAAIRAVPEEDLEAEVTMPWGPMTLEQVISYPHWNMSYHEGQINYIASMLGLLK